MPLTVIAVKNVKPGVPAGGSINCLLHLCDERHAGLQTAERTISATLVPPKPADMLMAWRIGLSSSVSWT